MNSPATVGGIKSHVAGPDTAQQSDKAHDTAAQAANEPRQVKRKPIEQRVEKALQQVNPLLSAARPLLRALADMPSELRIDQAGLLKTVLVQELHDFQTVCERAGLRAEHILAARYCVCTALDEAALSAPWGSRSNWASESLLIKLHGEHEGGEKVFHVLGRLVNNPEEHIDVIEVIYYLLALGFQGRYGNMTDGDRQHLAIRQRLYDLIRKHRGAVPRELASNLNVAPAGRLSIIRTVPLWLSASVLGVAAFGLFAWYKYQLSLRVHDLEQRIHAVGQITSPPPPKAAPLRLAELLKEEIVRGVVTVNEDAKHSAVIFRGDDMFAAGRADVNAKAQPLLNKVAAEIAKVPGKVTVTGHSDNQPIRTARFPSNQVLSEERAVHVSEYLASKGVAQGRLEAIGKGDTEPVADNNTSAGRAKNRRVEIDVTQQ
ncbi:Outer membrane protein A [Ralstonia sp. LMG 32965]|uniref:type VI secretion system protein TssL, long form n=1 Tax=Ralstonia flatus TaxID=3058601 RepID=UPI0028F50A43|nr:type VI secretion system protein TssL, long form [Ralstonia sp. LMG 32965]CAJ0893448.1 Outer membrane protein A [Ralstonia sp. LMG 32965]